MPGRPFFICAGVVQTSSAPAAKAAAAASGTSSGERSSRFVSISSTSPCRAPRSRLAEQDAHDVRHLLEVARAGAVADRARRASPGAGRSASASAASSAAPVGVTSSRVDLERHERRPPAQDLERGRRGQRQPAVGRAHEARARRAAGEHTTSSTPSVSSARRRRRCRRWRRRAPTSWKCTSSGSVPWMRRLGLGEPAEGVVRARRAPRRAASAPSISARTSPQVRCTCSCGASTSTRAPRRCRGARRASSREVEPVDAAAGRGRRARPLRRRRRRAARRAACRRRRPRRSRRRGARHAAPAAARAMRAAIVPAPKPSSMLTTASPAAHELSIASSAETPPNAAP